jgi:RepB DNA-primase from phage plasmid
VNTQHPAITYLEAIFEPDDLLCLTFIHGTKTYASGGAVTENKFVPMSAITIDGGIRRLTKRNEAEHIYVSMAPFKPGSENRTKGNIAEVRHVFMDADVNGDAVLASVRVSVEAGEIPPPTVVVQSSPGKYQFVWNVSGFDIPLQEALNRTLQKKFNTDAQAVDAARVLRIPGFRNIKAKYVDKPVATVVEQNPSFSPYEVSDFHIPLAEEPNRTVHEAATSKEVQASIDYLEAAMDAASVGFTRKPWDGSGGATKFMLAVCPWCDNHESGGDGDAIAIVMPSAKYAFKCLHAHCADKEWKDFRAHVKEQAAPTVLKFGERPPDQPKPKTKKAKASGGTPKSLGAAAAIEISPVQIIEPRIPSSVRTTVQARPDMPREVLCGRLGELCEANMLDDFPVAFAWSAMLTVASVLAPEQIRAHSNSSDDGLHNLYTALVGDVNCGKSQAIEWALATLRLKDDMRRYQSVKAGSAERLLKYMNQLAERVPSELGPRVLMDIDEWAYFFSKAAIENSDFPTLLTTGFYKRNQSILDSRGRPLNVPASFSWIGGIVDGVAGSYEDCFNRATALGLHDRFINGLAPVGFQFQYRPFDGTTLDDDFTPIAVQIDGSVYECLKEWRNQNPDAHRVAELALRAAYICASFDGQEVLYGKDLGPHWVFAADQIRVRKLLQPNLGDTPDAQCSIKIENYLKAAGPAGQEIPIREVMQAVHYERFGPQVFERTCTALARLEIVELGNRSAVGNSGRGRPQRTIRLVV